MHQPLFFVHTGGMNWITLLNGTLLNLDHVLSITVKIGFGVYEIVYTGSTGAEISEKFNDQEGLKSQVDKIKSRCR